MIEAFEGRGHNIYVGCVNADWTIKRDSRDVGVLGWLTWHPDPSSPIAMRKC